MTIKGSIVLLVASICTARADPRWIEGKYRNPALGYSISVPRGLKGLTGDQTGPERGLRISLSSGGQIVVEGEPNSLEWKTPEEGIRFVFMDAPCGSFRREIRPARVGRLTGAKGSFVCGNHVRKAFLAFRPGGSPYYLLQLDTNPAHESDDTAALDNMAASLRLIRWE